MDMYPQVPYVLKYTPKDERWICVKNIVILFSVVFEKPYLVIYR